MVKNQYMKTTRELIIFCKLKVASIYCNFFNVTFDLSKADGSAKRCV